MQVFLSLSLSLLLFSLSDRLNEQQSYYVSKFTRQMANLQFLQDLYTTKQNLHLNKLIFNLYIKQNFKYLLGWQCNKQLYTTKKSILAFELGFRKKKPKHHSTRHYHSGTPSLAFSLSYMLSSLSLFSSTAPNYLDTAISFC